jgi:hypothetical protein
MSKEINEFIELLNSSLENSKFVKLTFSKATNADLAKNIYVRPVIIKKGAALSFSHRYQTKDITKNYLLGVETNNQIKELFTKSYLIVTLITTEEEIILQINKNNIPQLQRKKSQSREALKFEEHNREKNYLVPEKSPFLQLLGISSSEYKILNDQRDKFRQINKYCEIMLSLIEQAELNKNSTGALRIVDMGSGKGYLSFALFDLLKRHFEMKIEMTGIELRKELCDFCNEKARVLGWNGLNFEAMDILDYQEKNNNVLIALHACDIATDIAIYQGIKNNSDLIVVAPCCHKQIRKQMNPIKPWNTMLEHGILMEREAELITDSLRSLLLQLNGYKTKVMEFISSVHTPKNIMIAGIKNKSGISPDMKAAIEKDIEEIKSAFGIKEHYLEKLLRGER